MSTLPYLVPTSKPQSTQLELNLSDCLTDAVAVRNYLRAVYAVVSYALDSGDSEAVAALRMIAHEAPQRARLAALSLGDG